MNWPEGLRRSGVDSGQGTSRRSLSEGRDHHFSPPPLANRWIPLEGPRISSETTGFSCFKDARDRLKDLKPSCQINSLQEKDLSFLNEPSQYFKPSTFPWTGALPTAAARTGCFPGVSRSSFICWMLASSPWQNAFSSVSVGEAERGCALMENKA